MTILTLQPQFNSVFRITSIVAKKATTIRRVLIVENELLLGAGIEHLLAGETDLDVMGITRVDEVKLLEEIRFSQPEVVILDRATCLINPTKLITRLPDYPCLRVIVISANDNLMQIFERQQVLVTHVHGLASLFYSVISYAKGGTA